MLNYVTGHKDHAFLTSVLDGDECSASCTGRFTLEKKNYWYPLDRRLSGPQAGSLVTILAHKSSAAM